jgi:hypothetical protein
MGAPTRRDLSALALTDAAATGVARSAPAPVVAGPLGRAGSRSRK